MTKPIDPYSRVYWRVAEDPRFAEIYPDDRHLGTWLRLLILADAMFPTAAPVPANARPASVKALVACGLIELIPGGLYRVHGLAAERQRRGRLGPDEHPTGPAEGPHGNPAGTRRDPEGTDKEPARTLARAGVDETRRDEQRQEPSRARADATNGQTDDLADDLSAVIDVVETLSKRGWRHRAESAPYETLAAEVRDFGPDRVIAAIREVRADHPDTAQLVFGARDILHPLVRQKAKTATERDAEEAKRIVDESMAEARRERQGAPA